MRSTPLLHAIAIFSACFAVLFWAASVIAQVNTTSADSLPELVLQTGHTYRIENLAFSNDSRLVASTSGPRGDGTIKLWEVSTRRQLRTLVGHTQGVRAIAFSPDGHWLASSGDDDTIRVWNVTSGREDYNFYAPAQWVESLLFSPDSRFLVSMASPYGRPTEPTADLQRCNNENDRPAFCKAKDLAIWDLRSASLLTNLAQSSKNGFRMEGWRAAFSADGKFLAFAKDGNEVGLWDMANNKELPSLQSSMPPFVIASDGRRMAASSANGGIVIWDLATRTDKVRINEPGIPVAFADHDARLITSTGKEGNEVVKFWSSTDGSQQEILTIDPVFNCANCSLHFSADGRWLARAGFGEPKLILWDLAAPQHEPRRWRDLNTPVVFSPDGRWLAANTSSYFDSNIAANNIWLLDLQSGEESCAIARPLRKIGAVAVSSKPARLATASGSGVDLWDLATGVRIKSLPGGDEAISALTFSPDGHWLMSGYTPNNEAVTWLPGVASPGEVIPHVDWQQPQCKVTARESASNGETVDESAAVWDMVTLKPHLSWPPMQAPIAVSSDSKQVANAYEGTTVNLWNLSDKTGRQLKLEQPLGRLVASDQTLFRAFAFSPQHHWFAIAIDGESTIKVLDLDTGKPVTTLRPPALQSSDTGPGTSDRYQVPPSNDVLALAFSANGILASASEDGMIRQWNVEESREITHFQTGAGYQRELAYSNDGRQLAATVGNKVVRWDTGSSASLPDLEGQPNTVNGLAFSTDGKLLFTASDDGTTRIWDTRTSKLLATLISTRNSDDWLVVTPQGLFDGTASAWKQILWRFDHDTFNYAPVESYFNDFFHPGLLQEIFDGKRPASPEGKELAKRDRRRPLVKIESDAQQSTLTNHNVTIRVTVTENSDKPAEKSLPASGGAQDVRLFRNGSLVKLWSGDVFHNRTGCVRSRTAGPKSVVCTTTAPIVAGNNEFSAYAFNHDNLKSDEAKPLLIKGDRSLEHKGVLYILAIGIDSYENRGYNLNFAVADVEDIAREFQARQDQLGNYAHTKIISLPNDQATKANIILALRRFANPAKFNVPEKASVETRQALENISEIQPEDALLIYFSGHGTSQDNHFYLLPYDFREANLKRSSIADTDLNEALEDVGAGKVLMVIDACQSGQALGNLQEGRGPMNAKGLAQLAYDKGMYILTASQSYQAALEVSRTQSGKRIEHGLLTFTLLDGLTKARADSAGRINEREWMNYAVEQVPLLQLEEMKRRNVENKRRSAQGQRGTELIFVGDDTEAQPERRNVQRPRVFYRRELEAHPFVVAKQN